jgi:transcriptional regulator GlxA family with amidase domain
VIARRPARRGPPPRRRWELEPLTGRRLADPSATIAVLVYRGVTTVEVEIPVQRLAELIGADIVLVGDRPGPVPGVEPARMVIVDAGSSERVRPDVLVVPGGLGWRQVAENDELSRWLADAAATARAVLAISTGTLLLASVGALDGRDATGHWLAEDDLARLGAHVQSSRVARADAGRLVTASGALAAWHAVDELADQFNWARDPRAETPATPG